MNKPVHTDESVSKEPISYSEIYTELLNTMIKDACKVVDKNLLGINMIPDSDLERIIIKDIGELLEKDTVSEILYQYIGNLALGLMINLRGAIKNGEFTSWYLEKERKKGRVPLETF